MGPQSMLAWRPQRLTYLWALSACWLVFPAAALAAPRDGEAQRLMAELNSPDFAKRQQAMLALQRLGIEAIAELAQAATAADAEVRARATAILMSQGLSAHTESRQAVRQALRELGRSPDREIRSRAQATLDRVQETAATAAAAELTRLGAVLMPVPGGAAGAYKVQIGANWIGGGERFSLLAELVDVPWLSLESAPVGDEALPHIARLGEGGRGPTSLYLGNSRITGGRLAALAPLTRLTYLSLRQLSITNDDLHRLPEFPELQYLGLDGTRIGNDGLKALARYSQLQFLWLDNTRVTDAGLVHLKPLGQLRKLDLPGTDCSGPGLAALADLPALTTLSLKAARLGPDSLKHLGHVEQLESLGLDHTNVTDDQLADVAGLAKLRILWLSGTAVGDEGVAHLRSLTSLQVLHLSDTHVTSDGAADLQHALPNCQVTRSNRQEPGTTRPGEVRPIRRPPPAPQPMP